MVGTTLAEIRRHVDELASDDGEYYLVCGRTGERPIPAAGKRFDGPASTRRAVRACEQYRTALRRYDPHLPYYDLIVCHDPESPAVVTADVDGPNVPDDAAKPFGTTPTVNERFETT